MEERSNGEIILEGIAASPGVAHGPVFVYSRKELEIPYYHVGAEKHEEEINRFEQALLETRRQIARIRAEIGEKLGEEEAQVFDAHLMVLEDRALIEETIREVTENHYNIEYGFQCVATRYMEAFARIDDDYLRERVADIRDVSRRLLNTLQGKSDQNIGALSRQRIVVSRDISPSDSASFEKDQLLALVSDMGSKTSHSAIMARSSNIPAVVGLHDITERVNAHDTLLVDGYDGIVIINPSDSSLFRYGRLHLQRKSLEGLYNSKLEGPVYSQDKKHLVVRMNVDGSETEEVLRSQHAEGVGLFRTEGLYLASNSFPDEETQYAAYKRVAEQSLPHDVIIRTLDLGGDKLISEGSHWMSEANPFMGWRAIRFCLENPQLFKTQLRAILRASVHGNVRMMYPMISSLHELLEANEFLNQCKAELRRSLIPFNEDMPVGCMIEIPSAAAIIDLLSEHCSFFSVGTNDLIQYLVAIDRVNDRVAQLYDPNNPAVMRTLQAIFDTARSYKRPVSVCGEMASEPVYAALLFGFGASEISVAVNALAEVKFMLSHIKLSDARALAKSVSKARSSAEIAEKLRKFHNDSVGRQISEITPQLDP